MCCKILTVQGIRPSSIKH